MLVTSRTKEEYEEHLIKFFRLFERHGFKANPAKCVRVPRIQRLCLKHQAVFRQILLAFYSSNRYPVGTVGAIGIIYVQEQENLIAGGLYSKHSKPKN
ncbi:hypothetical protein T05_11180, partial [Trichinella murrelli]